MDYVRATSILIGDVTLKDLAKATGRSHGVLRLARLDPSNPGYCNPPEDWQTVVQRLASKRAAELNKLADRLASERKASGRRGSARKRSATKKSGARKRTTARRRR